MESLNREKPKYGPEWFKDRAFKGLEKIGEGQWDYTDSLLLYQLGSDSEYEAVQEVDTPYHKLITAPERSYLEGIAPSVVNDLPENFEYIDLGPGTEHKEQFIFDAAKEFGRNFVYRPVDISDKYLKLSTEFASEQGITTLPLKSSFEELPQKIGDAGTPRFVSIGLTYGNYEPEKILPLLKSLAGENGTAFINAQIFERTDMEAMRQMYAGAVESLLVQKIALLGLDSEKDIADREVTDEVKVWYTLKNSNPKLEAKGVKAGDRLLVFQSIRPTLDSLEKSVAEVFDDYKILDTGESFVGVLLGKPKASAA
jgi:hypothetical protein